MRQEASAEPLPSFRLDGRLAVVTGASGGIGLALANAFAAAGARVVLAGRRPDTLRDAKDAIVAAGGQADVAIADVTRVSDLERLAATAGRIARDVDAPMVLVNNAGYGFTKPAIETSETDWDGLFDAHVKGAFFCARAFAPMMIERGYGKIINMSSTWSASTDAGKAAYSAAKGAVSRITAALSTEWAPLGIRVNALAPTATMTEFTSRALHSAPERAERMLAKIKLGRFGQTADLVGPAIFLASEASDFVTGHTLFVDGGWHATG